MITKAKFVNVYVADQDRALAFFTEALGFEALTDAPLAPEMGDRAGARWIVVAPKGADTGFVLYTPPGMESRVGGFSNVVFDSDDIVATYEDLKAKGVEFTMEPKQMPWGWWAQFKDSEGNEFGLGQARE